MILSIKTVLACFLLLFSVGSTLNADPVSIDFHGKIIENYSDNSQFDSGTTYYGSIIYEPLFCTDLNTGDNNIGSYHFGYMDFSIFFSTGTSIQKSINDDAATLINITIENNASEGLNDKFHFSTPNAAVGEFDYDLFKYYAFCSIDIDLFDTSGTAFNNDFLPESLNIENFDPESLYINSNLFKGNLATTPEPMTLLLLGSGFVGLLFAKKR